MPGWDYSFPLNCASQLAVPFGFGFRFQSAVKSILFIQRVVDFIATGHSPTLVALFLVERAGSDYPTLIFCGCRITSWIESTRPDPTQFLDLPRKKFPFTRCSCFSAARNQEKSARRANILPMPFSPLFDFFTIARPPWAIFAESRPLSFLGIGITRANIHFWGKIGREVYR